jgi:hypothetical protein
MHDHVCDKRHNWSVTAVLVAEEKSFYIPLNRQPENI